MLLTYKTILSKKFQLNSNTYLYHFDLIEPKEINFKAGQYLMLKIPSDKGPISRLYSIASSDTVKNSFQLIIGIVPGGLASNYLSSMSENTEVIFQGPAGIFSLKENNRPKIFLVTGTGIAPVRSILESSQLPTTSYQLFWGIKTYKDIYLLDELKQYNLKVYLSREKNLDMISEVDKKFFELGHINSCFEKRFNNLTIEQLNNYNFYLCGRREIVESLRLFLMNKGISQENIYFEKF